MADQDSGERTPPAGTTRRPQRRVPGLPTLLVAAASFLVIFEFLAFQLRAGRDPALGGVHATTAAAAPPRPVIVHRRIVVRRVVEAPAAPTPVSVGGSAGSSSAADSSAPAPAPASTPAPAPAAAPAPAPAPAPVTSSS